MYKCIYYTVDFPHGVKAYSDAPNMSMAFEDFRAEWQKEMEFGDSLVKVEIRKINHKESE